ncbi:MAG: glycolate oxidase subunit GlcF [Alphaproteobacteria bacterium]|nr:glycolate oxidase subunit GlcF [Alphaproteobacteria bacterium]
METRFSAAQLADPDVRASEAILRKCVHCGFCTATCPTYVLLGDELDSPRGRIYLIKDMLEHSKPASATVVKHVDRCLSCLSCMTTCPSGVNYMHLVDHARQHIAATYRRPLLDRALRRLLTLVLPHPGRLRLAMIGAAFARPFGSLLGARLSAMLSLAPNLPPPPAPHGRPQVFPANGARRMRVALLAGCVQQVVRPDINAATIRLLTRLGCEVVVANGSGCCGAIAHHLGDGGPALEAVRANVAAWDREVAQGGLDAIVANASGCGTMLKDYGFLLRDDTAWAAPAAHIAGLARDVSEVVAALGITPTRTGPKLAVAYHSACSLQHGQNVNREPRALLADAGFAVSEIAEGHLCCGSAGTYNILQPALARRLGERKAAAIDQTGAAMVATGNIGCMMQLEGRIRAPIVHTVELLDWATGGPRPPALAAAWTGQHPWQERVEAAE